VKHDYKQNKKEKTMTIVADIISGSYDSELDSIRAAISHRQSATRSAYAAVTMAELLVGDKVVLREISPKYMIGKGATVVGKRRTKLEVKLDTACGRFSKDTPIVVPASCVEKLEVHDD
jgi:hypothetical protein